MISKYGLDVSKWYSCCDNCQWELKFKATQPYRDYTYRIEMICQNYECEDQGIVQVIEVKVDES